MSNRQRLRDGSAVEIRAVRPEDREAIQSGFDRLSPESRYRRFFGPMPDLNRRELDYLTQVDHHNHEALIAFDRQTGTGVGVARYVRTGPDVAEPAVVVVDDWQGRGLGGVLLEALVSRAREEGVRRFAAPILATNVEANSVFERLGETSRKRAGREVELTIELPAEAQSRLAIPVILRQFAAGAVEPMRTVLDIVWPRRSGSPTDRRRNVIVVGTDGSDESLPTVELAGQIARASRARVEVVGAYRFFTGTQDELTQGVHNAAGRLNQLGIDTGEQIRRGDPALVLTEVAMQVNARLIVVGAGDRGKNTRRVLGSISDYVAERSPCDVLIHRPRE